MQSNDEASPISGHIRTQENSWLIFAYFCVCSDAGLLSVALVLWARAAAAKRRALRTQMSRVFYGWKCVVHSNRFWHKLASRFAFLCDQNVVETVFSSWWVWSARVALLRHATELLADMFQVHVIGTCLNSWRDSTAQIRRMRKLHRKAGKLRKANLVARVIDAWKLCIDVRVSMRNMVTRISADYTILFTQRSLDIWRQHAHESRRHRKAKKRLRYAVQLMPIAWRQACFSTWAGFVRRENALRDIGLEVLIRHNREVAAAAFRGWLAQVCSCYECQLSLS